MKQEQRNRILISEYESEEHLREADAFSLPSLNLFRKPHEALMNGIDGLTIAMAEENDILVTRTPLPEAYQRCWNENVCAIRYYGESAVSDSKKTIYELLQLDHGAHDLLRSNRIVNYALIPETYDMYAALVIPAEEPPLPLVQLMNRKSFSNDLKYRLDLPLKGVSVRSVEEYEREVPGMLKQYGTVLIKDSMGVSGKGILPIESQAMADRLAAHFRKQEGLGRTNFDFVLEPRVSRKTDFSCQFHIERSGTAVIDGYRKNEAKGYAYLGSGPLSEAETDLIQRSQYRDAILRIADEMAALGYFGYACADSMITEDNEVIPLLEINPRMSMARFSLQLERKLDRNCRLSYTEGIRASGSSLSVILEELESKGILFTKARGSGVLPLAPGTFEAPYHAGEKVRIYFAVLYETEEDYETILDTWIGYCAGRICSGPVRKKTA